MKLNESMEKEQKDKLLEIILDQKHFLEHHLMRWVPIFTEKIAESAETNYYQGISKILNGFIQLDYQVVCELLDVFS